MTRSPNYAHFWPRYLREHARPGTRRLHFIGTALTFAALFAAIATGRWGLLVLIPVLGYGFAWAGHALVERNKPATFTHPLWSLISDYRMFFLWLLGRLDQALDQAGVAVEAGVEGPAR